MQENNNKKTYLTIPNKGDIELNYLLDTIGYLRQAKWTYKIWKPSAALLDKSGGSSQQYVGQRFDPKYFDLVEDGWTHDHCGICVETISNTEGYGVLDGYEAENGEWVCNDCFELFIKSKDFQETIKSLKISSK